MKSCHRHVLIGLSVLTLSTVYAAASDAPTAPATYGSAVVSRVLKVDAACMLYCDIEAFIPLIGVNIPVQLNGIEIPGERATPDVVAFLEKRLMPKGDADAIAPTIVLNNMRRGETFCIVADITVDEKDLAEMLVQEGLARRIIRLGEETAQPQSGDGSPSAQPAQEAEDGFIASRTSRVFHRPTCSHARRLDTTKAITFNTRAEAEQNGRRPCKTCKP